MNNCICNLEEEQNIYIEEESWTYLILDRRSDGFYLEASGDGIAEKRINYCPMCGRDLNS